MAEFIPIDELAFKRAQARAGRDGTPRAVSARYDRRSRRIAIALDTGLTFSFKPEDARGLEHASAEQLKSVEIDGAGDTLAVPALDAHFSVSGLLETFLGPLDWSRRQRRALASRENGKLGGRPRKLSA